MSLARNRLLCSLKVTVRLHLIFTFCAVFSTLLLLDLPRVVDAAFPPGLPPPGSPPPGYHTGRAKHIPCRHHLLRHGAVNNTPTIIGNNCTSAYMPAGVSIAGLPTEVLFNLTEMAQVSKDINGPVCEVQVLVDGTSWSSYAQLGVVGSNTGTGCAVSVRIANSVFSNALLVLADLQLRSSDPAAPVMVAVDNVTSHSADLAYVFTRAPRSAVWPMAATIEANAERSFDFATYVVATAATFYGHVTLDGYHTTVYIGRSNFSITRGVDFVLLSGETGMEAASGWAGLGGSVQLFQGATFIEDSCHHANHRLLGSGMDIVAARLGAFRCGVANCSDTDPGFFLFDSGTTYTIVNSTMAVTTGSAAAADTHGAALYVLFGQYSRSHVDDAAVYTLLRSSMNTSFTHSGPSAPATHYAAGWAEAYAQPTGTHQRATDAFGVRRISNCIVDVDVVTRLTLTAGIWVGFEDNTIDDGAVDQIQNSTIRVRGDSRDNDEYVAAIGYGIPSSMTAFPNRGGHTSLSDGATWRIDHTALQAVHTGTPASANSYGIINFGQRTVVYASFSISIQFNHVDWDVQPAASRKEFTYWFVDEDGRPSIYSFGWIFPRVVFFACNTAAWTGNATTAPSAWFYGGVDKKFDSDNIAQNRQGAGCFAARGNGYTSSSECDDATTALCDTRAEANGAQESDTIYDSVADTCRCDCRTTDTAFRQKPEGLAVSIFDIDRCRRAVDDDHLARTTWIARESFPVPRVARSITSTSTTTVTMSRTETVTPATTPTGTPTGSRSSTTTQSGSAASASASSSRTAASASGTAAIAPTSTLSRTGSQSATPRRASVSRDATLTTTAASGLEPQARTPTASDAVTSFTGTLVATRTKPQPRSKSPTVTSTASLKHASPTPMELRTPTMRVLASSWTAKRAAAPVRSTSFSPTTPSTQSRPFTVTPSIAPTGTRTSTAAQTASASATATAALPTPAPAPAALPVPKPLADSAVASSGTTAVVGAGASPAAALQVARAVGVLAALTACGGAGRTAAAGPTRQLAFPKSLVPGLGAGPAAGAYHRGAVVAAVLGLAAALVLAAALGALVSRCAKLRPASEKAAPPSRDGERPKSLKEHALSGLKLARMPGLLVVVAAVAADGVATALVVLPAAGLLSPVADVALMAVGCGLLAGAAGFVLVAARRGPASGAVVYAPIEATHRSAMSAHGTHGGHGVSNVKAPLAPLPVRLANSAAGRWLLVGDSTWVPAPRSGSDAPSADDTPNTEDSDERAHVRALELLEHLGAAFGKYRGAPLEVDAAGDVVDGHDAPRRGRYRASQARTLGERWRRASAALATRYLAADLALTAVAAGFEGAVWADCVTGAVGMAVANGAALLLALAVRPYSVPAKNVLLVVVSAVTFAAAAAAAAAVVAERSAAESGNAARAAAAERLRGAAGSMAAAAALLSNVSVAMLLFRFAVFHVCGLRVQPDAAALERLQRAAELGAIASAHGPDDADSDVAQPLLEVPLVTVAPFEASCPDALSTSRSSTASSGADEPAVPASSAPAADDIDLDALLASDNDDDDAPRVVAQQDDASPASSRIIDATAVAAPRQVRRTEEGQRRYREVEQLLDRGQHARHPHAPGPKRSLAARMAPVPGEERGAGIDELF